MAEIILTINNIADVADGVKHQRAMPQIEDPENPGQFIDEFTDIVWIKTFIRDMLLACSTNYKKKVSKTTNVDSIIDDEAIIDDD